MLCIKTLDFAISAHTEAERKIIAMVDEQFQTKL